MMIYILRHASAANRDRRTFPDDRLRPLTDSGRKSVLSLFRKFKDNHLRINLIMTSPFTRAVETANLARTAMHLKKDVVLQTENLSPLGAIDGLINEVLSHGPIENLLLVGHEPNLSELASVLLIGDTNLSITLKKGGLCCLSTDELVLGKCASLEWLMNPKQIHYI
jgi:phosphohistidine phosphatase